MDSYFPKSLHEVRHCLGQLVFLLLVTTPSLIYGQCNDTTDMTGPNLTCIDSITLGSALPNTFFGVSDYNATDPSGIDGEPEYSLNLGDPSAGGFIFPPGSTELTLTVMDACGNPSSCVINIINALTELPVNNCPNFTETAATDVDAGTYLFSPNYGPGDVTTNGDYHYHGQGSPAMPTVDFTTTPTLPGPPFSFPVGTSNLTTTISDTELNFTCLSTIIVRDNQSPDLTCPADIDSDNPVVSFTVNATDNADPSPTLTYAPLGPDSVFPLGRTIVNVTATDSSLNTRLCTFRVNVTDNTGPNITCPASFNSDIVTVFFTVDVTDNFDPSPELTYDPLCPGSVFPLGPTIVTVTATDESLNQRSCSFTVTVSVPQCISQ